MAASDGDVTMEPAPMAGVQAPLVQMPAAPTLMDFSSLSPPDFTSCHEVLEEVAAARERLKETTSTGSRLAYLATAKTQRADAPGAKAVLQKIEELPSLAEVVGPRLWSDKPRLMNLCEAAGVSYFVENYISSLSFLHFLETGELTRTYPKAWETGVQDYDDECYLCGLISALRELERYSTNRGQELDLGSVRMCLGTAQCLEEALMQFNFRNSALRQRFDSVKYAVKKLESLAYEISLAKLRAGSADAGGAGVAAEAPPSSPPAGAATVINLQLVGDMKLRYDQYDEQREQVMKRSRDVVKAAKNAIYALHRGNDKVADANLASCAKDASAIYEDIIKTTPRLRLGFFSGALEEFAEALAYKAFRREGRLPSLQEMQGAAGLSFQLLVSEYLGGLMDLTGEVGRTAIRSASQGRASRDVVKGCLACVDAVYNGLQELPYIPGKLGKKMGPLKQTLTKIEGALYELALLSDGQPPRLGRDAEEDVASLESGSGRGGRSRLAARL